MPTHLAAFVTAVALLAILPGANNVAVTRQTLTHGRRAGLLTVAGASTGILLWSAAAALGLSAVLLSEPDAYRALRLAGAAVLAALGLHSLWSLRVSEASAPLPFPSSAVPPSGWGSFAVGVATSLGNPKAGVVAVSLLPQFVTSDGPVPVSLMLLGALWAAVSGTWFCCYVWAVDRGRARIERPAFRRALQAATGLTLIGLGIAVAAGA